MKKLKKAATGILTLALSFSIVGTSVAPTFADDTGKNLEELQKAVTKAQEEYDAAENAYDNAPKKFLEDRMCDKHKSTLNFNQYIDNIQNATGKNAEELHTAMENRKKEFTTADGKEDIQKKKSYAQKWISFDNLKLQSKWLDALNQRRYTDKNKESIEELGKSYSNNRLKINPELVMDSMMSAMIGYYTDTWHVLGRSSVAHKEWWGFNENQAFASSFPIELWYDEELSLYNEGERNIDGSINFLGVL